MLKCNIGQCESCLNYYQEYGYDNCRMGNDKIYDYFEFQKPVKNCEDFIDCTIDEELENEYLMSLAN